ncbi:MAG TPA: MOSC domain-containing protein [Methylomirabilota bacterium]|nr:MOSC domain-containing protein [Methylomirabilota bacterium]
MTSRPDEVVSIHIAPEAGKSAVSVQEIRAVPGKGLEGDRYFNQVGTYCSKQRKPDHEITLIEIEAIESLRRGYGIEVEPGESRRNIVTRGVSLNHLVGHEFRVGDVAMRGIRLCEPCEHLEQLSNPGVRRALVHRGGLRAQLLSEGVIRMGDRVSTSQRQ